MDALTVFTDGACSGNPGPGGWAAILLTPDGRVRELGGSEPRTTNNRMELKAVIEALRLSRGRAVRLYTDSTYVIAGANTWVHAWKRKGWTTSEGNAVLNRDLWEELDGLAAAQRKRGLSWHYVRGHTGSPGNECSDDIAVRFSRGEPVELYDGPLSRYPHDLLDLPADTSLPERKPGSPRKKTGGYYLSLLAGKLERHDTWAGCRERVHGKSGARSKKVATKEEEVAVLRRWGL